MKKIRLCILLSALAFAFASAPQLCAQFRSEAFTQSYNDDTEQSSDSADVLFTFKDYFEGLGHKHEIKSGVMFAGSAIFVGGCQIYNKQYWKLPIVYGTIGAGLGLGFHFKNVYDKSVASGLPNDKAKTWQTLSFVGAGLAYWGTLMDGISNYEPADYPHPGRATIYSILLPGLGQIYNHDYWKLPIYWGGLIGSIHYCSVNNSYYQLYKRIYKEANDPTSGYSESISPETALYYRDVYRRYRDYSIVAIAAFYLLQIIDANVFSYLQNFEVNDDLSLNVSPTVIAPQSNQYAFSSPDSAFGLRFGLTF